MTDSLESILSRKLKPAILIGNGINRFPSDIGTSWDDLLANLTKKAGLKLTKENLAEMSNTELYDILDLAQPASHRHILQQEFCKSMQNWKPREHHVSIVSWAERHKRPIITVNFDEMLSNSISTNLHRTKSERGFTRFYPWDSYYSNQDIIRPENEFAIWHAHGMVNYTDSIRLGLMHYMGSVQRARSWMYKRRNLLVNYATGKTDSWEGRNTWLEAFFFSPLLIVGFNFAKDETFFRWLFLERARLRKATPDKVHKAWYVTRSDEKNSSRRPFFSSLGIEIVEEPDYESIYTNRLWKA